jgi:hypothetical protein
MLTRGQLIQLGIRVDFIYNILIAIDPKTAAKVRAAMPEFNQAAQWDKSASSR